MLIKDRVKELRRVQASTLRPSPRNWRTHPKAQREALQGVLAEIGYADALLAREVEGGLELIDGHLRAETTPDSIVPVLILDVTESEAAKILATLDPLAAMAQADSDRLDALLRDVQTGSEAVAGMLSDLAEKAGLAYGRSADDPSGGGDDFDATPAEEGPTRTNQGELWVIGGAHRLLVGDCTDPESVARLLDGETVGLCFTSPPYAQQRDYGEQAKEKVQDWDALMQGAFAHLPMVEDGQVLVNLGLIHRDGEWVPYWDAWIEWMRSQGWRRFGWYVWDQGWGLPGDWSGRLAPSHEWLFHFNKQAVKPAKIVDSKMAGQRTKGKKGLRDKDGNVGGFSHAGPNGEYTYPDNKIPDSVIREYRQCGSAGHPAPFSTNFAAFLIECWPADVYDPFLGSGTTLIAAHRLGRRCYGLEIEPRYADVILARAEAEGLSVHKVT